MSDDGETVVIVRLQCNRSYHRYSKCSTRIFVERLVCPRQCREPVMPFMFDDVRFPRHCSTTGWWWTALKRVIHPFRQPAERMAAFEE